VVRIQNRMDTHVRRADGSATELLAETRFDNHNKVTIHGIVQVGTRIADINPLEDADRLMPRCHYYPVPYVGGGVFTVDIRPGDIVWFHYLCAEDDAHMERNRDGSWDITMQVSDIFCYSRHNRMHMNQNWIWGEEVKDTTLIAVDALGYEKRAAIPAAKGIEIVPGVTLPPYVDEARVLQIDPCLYRSVHHEIFVPDRVYLAKDAAFPNVIQGQRGLLFRHTDVLARYHRDPARVMPVGSNHLVRVEEGEYKSAFIKHTHITIAPEWGEVVSSGRNCTAAKPGDKIIFTRRWTRLLSRSYYLVEDGEIQAHLQ